MTQPITRVEVLRGYISDEIIKALGLSISGWPRRLLERLVWSPAHRFALLGASFDRWVTRSGFGEAARRVLPRFISDYKAHGAEHIPREGPLLITAFVGLYYVIRVHQDSISSQLATIFGVIAGAVVTNGSG